MMGARQIMKRVGTIRVLAALGLTLGLTLGLPLGGWAQSYTVGPVRDGGRVTGRVSYAGAASERERILVGTDDEVCAGEKYSEGLIVDPANRGLEGVVVSLRGISSGKDWTLPEGEPGIDQRGCWFHPHIVVVPVGQALSVLNSDGILHNLHTHSYDNRPVNKAQPGLLKSLSITFRVGEFVKLTCDVHDWMEAWIVVADHPYVAVTDEAGSFLIDDIPPGRYTLEFWHETLGLQSQDIEVAPGAATQADLSFPEGQ